MLSAADRRTLEAIDPAFGSMTDDEIEAFRAANREGLARRFGGDFEMNAVSGFGLLPSPGGTRLALYFERPGRQPLRVTMTTELALLMAVEFGFFIQEIERRHLAAAEPAGKA